MIKYNPDQEKEIQILNNPKLKKHNKHSKMVELNKSNFTEEFHLDLHGSPMQCIYSYTVFILYLLDKFIYSVAIQAEIIQMYLFSI